MQDIIDGINVEYPYGMTIGEARQYVAEEKRLWIDEGKKPSALGKIVITLDDDYVVIKALARIVRTRRITGYLSNVENFNDAKRSELAERVKHF
jgi:hypothetical protein